jgi:hypothetical protein
MDTHQPDANRPLIAPDDAPPESLIQGDKPPTRGLFITLFVLSIIVAASMVGLWQLTSLTITNHRAASGPDPRLVNLRTANINARDFPERTCVAKCDQGDEAKILRAPLSDVVLLMNQDWAKDSAALIAPFGPKATSGAPTPSPQRPPLPVDLRAPRN